MLDREEILSKAITDCFREMYAKAQPSADWDQLVQDAKDGKIKKEERVYDRYYLSSDEFRYITDKYMDAYRIRSEWKEDVDVVLEFLKNGAPDYVYNSETKEKEFVRILGLREELGQFIEDSELLDKVYEAVMDKIKKCQTYYRFDGDERSFRFSTALGASPTSNMETVKKYWKEKDGIDLEIEERNPLTFWEKDEYGEEFENIMEEEYGEDWKEQLDKEWKERTNDNN